MLPRNSFTPANALGYDLFAAARLNQPRLTSVRILLELYNPLATRVVFKKKSKFVQADRAISCSRSFNLGRSPIAIKTSPA